MKLAIFALFGRLPRRLRTSSGKLRASPFFVMIGSLTMFSRGFRSIQTAPTSQPLPTPMSQTRQLRP